MAKHREGYCQICGSEVEVVVSAYGNRSFIDGKTYKEICFSCAEVPKDWEFFKTYNDGSRIHEEVVVYYNGFDQGRLHTVEEMVKDGFTCEEAKKSIRAVKAAIKRGIKLPKPKPLPVPIYEKRTELPPPIILVEDMSNRRRKKRRKKNNHNNHPVNDNVGNNIVGKKHRHKHLVKNSILLKTDITIREIDGEILDNKV